MIFSPSEDGSFYFDDISGDEKSGSVLASSVFYGLATLQLRVTSSPPLCTFIKLTIIFQGFCYSYSLHFFLKALRSVLKLPQVYGGSMSQSSLLSVREGGFNECVCPLSKRQVHDMITTEKPLFAFKACH